MGATSRTAQEDNLYAPPTSGDPLRETGDVAQAEAMRRPYLKHEASIKGMGFLFLLGGLVNLLWAVPLAVGAGTSFGFSFARDDGQGEVVFLCVAIVVLAVVVCQVFIGAHLRRFKRWARSGAIGLSVLLLILVPIGTLIGLYFILILVGKGGAQVFSEPYQRAMALTPHLKYRTPLWNWIVLGVILILLVASIIWASSV